MGIEADHNLTLCEAVARIAELEAKLADTNECNARLFEQACTADQRAERVLQLGLDRRNRDLYGCLGS